MEMIKKLIEKGGELLGRRKKAITKEIIVNAEALENRVAVMENGQLEEFTIERTSEKRIVASIFKGKIKNLEPGLKAAFVDIGFEKNAFLHYWDIVPESLAERVDLVEPLNGGPRQPQKKISQQDIPKLYPPGTEVIVQVVKGPIGTKGPRITSNISIPGRYLVLMPNNPQRGISRKIDNDKERQRLKQIVRELKLHGHHRPHRRRTAEGPVLRPRPGNPAAHVARGGGENQERARAVVRVPRARPH
jgi:ribonuclease G